MTVRVRFVQLPAPPLVVPLQTLSGSGAAVGAAAALAATLTPILAAITPTIAVAASVGLASTAAGAGAATLSPAVAVATAVALNPMSAGPPDTLLIETFEDSSFAARGWYDIGGTFVLDSSNPHSGTNSVRFTWSAGNALPDNGWAGRIKFTATDQVYLEYWVRYSSNYAGSGQTFHPHEWHLMTDEDSDFVGPVGTRLTVYAETQYQGGIVARIAAGDNANVDQANIGVDLTGVTENRAANGCNGFLETSHTSTSCFDSGGGVFTHDRVWDDPGVSISDAEKTNWHRMGLFVKLNSVVGGIGQQDGVIQQTVDGVTTMDHRGVVIRTGQFPDMKFDQLLVAPFIGNGAPATQSVWYDDLTIRTNPPSMVAVAASATAVALTPTFSAAGGAFATPDLLDNASFETGWDAFHNWSGGDPSSTSASTIVRSTEQAFNGTTSAKVAIPSSGSEQGVQFNYTYGDRSSVFLRFYYYATNFPTSQLKWVRWQTAGFGEHPISLYTENSGQPAAISFESGTPFGNTNNFYNGMGNMSGFLNAWHYWEFEVDSSVARVRTWHDGVVQVPTPNGSSGNFVVGEYLHSGGGPMVGVGMITVAPTSNAPTGNAFDIYFDRVALSTQRIGP